jgi:hypothetical protein
MDENDRRSAIFSVARRNVRVPLVQRHAETYLHGSSREISLSGFISYLFAMLVVTPLQAELSQRLQGMPSQELVEAGKACIAVEGPGLLRYAQDNWSWAAVNAIGVGVGMVDPITLLPQGNENCRLVIQSLAMEGSRNV